MHYSGEKVTKTALADLLAEGLSQIEIAQALGVSERSVNRGMLRHGFRAKRVWHQPTEAEKERMLQLAAEQMPLTWIAEDVGFCTSLVAKIIGPDPERDRIWKQEWQYIRRNQRMLELNDEIRPKRDRYAA